MMTRIADTFAGCARDRRAALVTYVMAGDPDPVTAQAVVNALPAAGADIIELGMPFSDPMADGEAIQQAGLRALKAGMSLKGTLETAKRFRETNNSTPIVVMGYYNPIYVYGVDRFLADCKTHGVDGLIVVDLPPEMDEELWHSRPEGRNCLHSPCNADDGRQAPAEGAEKYVRLCLLCLHDRDHRRKDR